MNNQKTTKRSLVAAGLVLLLCIAMLVGTTFAWFTDSASTAVNKIQAGTLDIELQYQKADGTWADAEGTTLDFKKAAGHENEAILWEPGCTYQLPELRIVNNGNLALKYKIIISGIQGDAKLNEAIDWTMTLDSENYVVGSEHKLAAKNGDAVQADVFTIKGHMKESAGNEYQGKSITGIAITVVATQDTVEYDSFNNTYDENAAYAQEQHISDMVAQGYTAVNSADGLQTAFEGLTTSDEQKVVLSGNVLFDNMTSAQKLTVPAGKELTLDLNGYTIDAKDNGAVYSLIEVANGAEMILNDEIGTGKISFEYVGENANWAGKAAVYCGGNMTMNGGVIENNTSPDKNAICFGVDLRPNVWGGTTQDATFTMNGGTIICENDEAVRVAQNSGNAAGSKVTFNMNGGTVSGWDAIFVQQLDNNFDSLYVNVNGGTLTGSNYAIRLYNGYNTWTLTNCVDGNANIITLNDGTLKNGSNVLPEVNGIGLRTPNGTLDSFKECTEITDNR